MSVWPGKFVIGLTGNIATGKSVVRKMLEHLGAFGIDADGISHQAMAKGGPAYPEIVKTFGEFILAEDGQIDRAILGNVVFNNPKALAKLESITHPVIRQAINILGGRAKQKVVVIEAIKLLEGELAGMCDSIWVVNAPEVAQVARLTQKRNLSPDQARTRISAQNPQTDKIRKANIVIQNSGAFDDTWTQVQSAWAKVLGQPQPQETAPLTPLPEKPISGTPTVAVRKGKPSDANSIAAFVTRASNNARRMSRADVMEAFGQKAFVLAQVNEDLGALAGWQVENLVTRVDDFYFLNNVPPALVLKPMLDTIEVASRDLQSEASFLFVSHISITAWRDAVKESQPDGTIVMFKKLREDRVLRPV
jgi:dephospho-CoA kinase